jgi:menaquinone-dependent protoporphyrinogen oxidase
MKIQVITATRHGSTAEVGEAIARRLGERGHEVNIFDAGSAELKPDQPVVLGSPIYMGKWLKPARAVLDRLAAEPTGRQVFIFSLGPVGDPPKPENASPEDAVVAFAADRAVSTELFAGRLDSSQLGRLERFAIKAVKAPDGDYRDWPAIEKWAEEIADLLAPADMASRTVTAGV